MLDQVALAGTLPTSIGNEFPHRVELLITREDQESFPRLASFRVFLLDFVDKLADEIKDAVARPSLLPEISGRVARLRRRNGWIAGTAEPAFIEGQETCIRP